MKFRFLPYMLVTFFLFSTLPISVDANPNQLDTQDALIRQVLTATMDELGWNTSVDYVQGPNGIPTWNISIHMPTKFIYVRAFNSISAANNEIQKLPYQQYQFHGYSAINYATGGARGTLMAADRFTIEVYSESGSGVNQILDAFYRNGVTYGFLTADSSITTPAVTETLLPEITLTPEPGTVVALRAYTENYETVTKVIDNGANFGSISIAGRVVDLNTGAGIGGAVIEIVSGASSGSTQSAADGSYSLSAVVPGGQDSGEISDFNFELPVKSDLTVEVIPNQTELVADGTSTSDITIMVKDLQGNPLKDRGFSLEISADAGPGTIQPTQATTDGNGIIQATYTAFKLEPGQVIGNTRHEVTISAKDNATGIDGTNSIFVNQYQLTVLHGEYIPACTQCIFPSEFTVSVTDYWNNPIPDAPLTMQIAGGSADGSLVSDPNSNADQQEISVTTNNNGQATVFFKWQGAVDIAEALRQVVVLDGTTHSQETKDVRVHGLDIGIARVEEAGFTGVTGHEAFLKIYFVERVHPDLQLDRFNADTPNKLGIQVIISQYHSDGVNTSLTYQQTGGWEQDDGGLFLKMYGTPHMPFITPVNDGSSWYEVRVDPIIDQTVLLPDTFRPNNDTIIALLTGSPDGWLHIWLEDGVLTPHSWAGVLFKCVGQFLPYIGDGMTVIDTLNQAYNQDVLGLGQSTATVITDQLQEKAEKSLLTKYKASTINNVISCIQDGYAVYNEKNSPSSSSSGGICAKLVFPLQEIIPSLTLEEDDADRVSVYQDRYLHGVLLDSPDQRGIVVYGVQAGEVTLRDASGSVFEDSDRMEVGGNVAVYILPVEEHFKLEITSDHDFDIGVYEAGTDDTNRKTIRHKVQTDTNLSASMDIDSTSFYDLELDTNDDGVFDETQNAQTTTMDVVKPQITTLQPDTEDKVSEDDVTIQARYADNPGGVGIDLNSVSVWVNKVDHSTEAEVLADGMTLSIQDLEDGEHTVRLAVSDLDGNAAVAEWTFIVQRGFLSSLSNTTLFFSAVGGILILLLLGGVGVLLFLRNQKRPKTAIQRQGSHDLRQGSSVQDQQGNWWNQNPNTGGWSIWNGQAWQLVQGGAPNIATPTPPMDTPGGRQGCNSCLFTVAVSGFLVLLVVGGISLVGLNFFPDIQIEIGQGDLTEILKLGGGGLLVSVLGVFLLNGGFKAIITRRTIVEDEWGRSREKRGCSAIWKGLGQLTIGILCLGGGLGLMTLALFQEVLPWLGL